MEESSNLLQKNRKYGPLLRGFFGLTDGWRMRCIKYTYKVLQNAYWEGYTQSDEITNLFVWDFKGQLIHAGINFPGSWHDSRVAVASGLYYPRLSFQTPTGFALLADSAFPRANAVVEGRIARSRKSNEWGRREVCHTALI